MDYTSASVDDIFQKFLHTSRQRLSQIELKYKQKGNQDVVKKFEEVRKRLKRNKLLVKHEWVTPEARNKARELWGSVDARCGKHPSYLDCVNGFKTVEDLLTWSLSQVGFLEDGWELDKDLLVKGNRVYSPETCLYLPEEVNGALRGCFGYARRGDQPIGVTRAVQKNGTIRYIAQMGGKRTVGKKTRYLGSFGTAEEAFRAYKAAKERDLRDLADKWKDQIDPRAYEALMKWEVEITD